MGIATVQGVGANQSDPPSTTPDLAVADKAGADKAGPTKQKETPTKHSQVLSLWSEHLDAIVAEVCYIHITTSIKSNIVRKLELSVSTSSTAKAVVMG